MPKSFKKLIGIGSQRYHCENAQEYIQRFQCFSGIFSFQISSNKSFCEVARIYPTSSEEFKISYKGLTKENVVINAQKVCIG